MPRVNPIKLTCAQKALVIPNIKPSPTHHPNHDIWEDSCPGYTHEECYQKQVLFDFTVRNCIEKGGVKGSDDPPLQTFNQSVDILDIKQIKLNTNFETESIEYWLGFGILFQ